MSIVGTEVIHSVNETSRLFPFCVSLISRDGIGSAAVTVNIDFVGSNNAIRELKY